MTLHDAPARVDADHRPDGVLEAARRLTPILPIGLCLLVVMVATGLAIVHVLDGVREWDLDMMRRLVESRTTTLDRLTEWGTWFAETIPVVVITVVVVAFARWKTGRWSVPLAFAAAIGSEKLIYLLTSVIVQRDRPPVPTLGETYATASFPSGHVGSAIALYGGIALVAGVITGRRAIRLVLLVAAIVVAAIVGYCRMYRGFHYPTDVIAGFLLGATCLAAAWIPTVERDCPGA
jgi:undecaprenyl-diphosphatase